MNKHEGEDLNPGLNVHKNKQCMARIIRSHFNLLYKCVIIVVHPNNSIITVLLLK